MVFRKVCASRPLVLSYDNTRGFRFAALCRRQFGLCSSEDLSVRIDFQLIALHEQIGRAHSRPEAHELRWILSLSKTILTLVEILIYILVILPAQLL